MQLWVIVEGREITACGVTQILNYPRKKVCLMLLVSGRDFHKWSDKLDEIGKWASDIGCTSFEAFCRPGWKRVLKDWEEINTVMRKPINENLH